MHEIGLVANLLKKIEDLARLNEITKVTKVHLSLGQFPHISPQHLRDHFSMETQGSLAENAELDIEIMSDGGASDIFLKSIEGV